MTISVEKANEPGKALQVPWIERLVPGSFTT
jgi:hypothetical protein